MLKTSQNYRIITTVIQILTGKPKLSDGVSKNWGVTAPHSLLRDAPERTLLAPNIVLYFCF